MSLLLTNIPFAQDEQSFDNLFSSFVIDNLKETMKRCIHNKSEVMYYYLGENNGTTELREHIVSNFLDDRGIPYYVFSTENANYICVVQKYLE